MRDEEKTREQLIQELVEARNRNIELEKAAVPQIHDNIYQAVFENTPIPMALVNSSGQWLDINSALEDLCGYSLEQLQQMDMPCIGNQALQDILAAPPTKEIWHEVVFEGHPSRYFEVISQAVETSSNPDDHVLVFREVTTERTLGESEEKYRQLFSNELDAISIFNPKNGQILDVNQAYLELYGYSKEEVLAMTVSDISAEPDVTMKAVQGAISTSSARILVRWHKKKDGTVFPVEIYAGTFEWNGQEVMYAAMRNITERMEAEQQRVELVLERERVKILSSFITQASHEFKTPLSSIKLSAYLLGKTSDPDNVAKHIHQIEFQIDNTTTLINTLTTMTKLDSGESLAHVEVDVNELVQQVCQLVEPMALEANQDVVLEVSEEPLYLLGDYAYLQKAIEYILRNAIRYTRSGGTITVCSKCLAGNAVIEINDTGIGMDKDTQRHIFERFYRADVAGTTRGFGLGLPIAKAIIEEHEGQIEVESELGKGSTFTILLPIRQHSLIGFAVS